MQFKNVLAFLTAVGSVSASGSVALYWGQKSGLSLADTCDGADADIVILSFLNDFGISSPSLNFAGNCDETDSEGMLKCPQIGEGIQHCQSKGKKVLLSLGGGVGSYGFNDDSQAEDFAETLWNLFGEGSGKKPLSPGTVDGFDFDIENNNPKGYAALVNKLKSDYFPKGKKQYYIGAAPQCPYPDASVGDLLTGAPVDYAFIQFYNNPSCSLTGSFNFDKWSQEASSSFANKDIKLFVGLPGSQDSAGSGYVGDKSVLQKQIGSAAKSSHFGGVMFWDAYTANENKIDGDKNIIQVVRDIMGSPSDEPVSSSPSSSTSLPVSSAVSSSAAAVSSPIVSSSNPQVPSWKPYTSGTPTTRAPSAPSASSPSGNNTTTTKVELTTTITIPIYTTVTLSGSSGSASSGSAHALPTYTDSPLWNNATVTKLLPSGNNLVGHNPSLSRTAGGSNEVTTTVIKTITETATETETATVTASNEATTTATVTATITNVVTVTVSSAPRTVSICDSAPSAGGNLAARDYAIRHKHAVRHD